MNAHKRRLLLVLALLAAFAVAAQEPPPPGEPPPGDIPHQLEELVGMAIHNNPEVRLAEIECERAQVELMRVRQKVAREVIGLFHGQRKAEAEIGSIHAQLEEIERAVENGTVPQRELHEWQVRVHEAEADLPTMDAEMRYLLGILPGGEGPHPHEGRMEPGHREPRPQPRPPLPERSYEALQRPITIDGKDVLFSKDTVCQAVEELRRASGLNIVFGGSEHSLRGFSLVDATIEEAMTALAEATGNELCFVFRDYGVLVTPTERAHEMPGPVIPSYIPYYGPPE